ncbi:N-acetyltransferase [Xenorhabdus beddingii]|uniref:N-acetyltransferase n=1 Tax=Xenorhabdus beddingii TaxID=40578 RepID=A0A1Y2SKL8_9GAMM|nr:N-acetyltransferase [Xenorhabdus beddingii]OTA19040.1 N-acetyltransferase [Xenorhabdus beddingii]
MLKRINSFNGYISKRLFQSPSFNILPPDNILNININHNNPRLINGYIPAVKEVELNEAISSVSQLHHSILNDGWFNHILDIDNQKETRQEIRNKTGLWNMRCHTTNKMLVTMTEKFNKNHLDKKDQYCDTYAYFILYIDRIPIGAMLFKGYTDESIVYPEIELLVTHPGIQNCAYLLMEAAVNKSYQIGCIGNVKLLMAEEELYGYVYARMGFTHWTCNELILIPSQSDVWIFTPPHGGYRFKGTCLKSID